MIFFFSNQIFPYNLLKNPYVYWVYLFQVIHQLFEK